jgi:hypothetical protein
MDLTLAGELDKVVCMQSTTLALQPLQQVHAQIPSTALSIFLIPHVHISLWISERNVFPPFLINSAGT